MSSVLNPVVFDIASAVGFAFACTDGLQQTSLHGHQRVGDECAIQQMC